MTDSERHRRHLRAVLSGERAYASRMTLVISVSTPAYALHVSDRLVSKGGRPHDPLANKTVVVRANDGLLVIGYTGLAFREGLPTDNWIANVVINGALSGNPIPMLAFASFPIGDIGSTLNALADRIKADTMFRRYGLQLAAAGWQWNERRRNGGVRNVLWATENSSSVVRWKQLVPRHPPERTTTFRMLPTGNWPLSVQDWQQLLDEVGQAGYDWRHVEQCLIETIRRCSDRTPGTIGRHCMSVLLPSAGAVAAEIRFAPAEAHQAVAFDQIIETAYSPWLVAPDAVLAPSVIVGGMRCEQGLLPYSLESPAVPDAQHLKAAWHAQQRSRN